ncbi:MAG: GAF domain-containing sensor histidine kinase [Acidimicrobiales bacterium]
MAWVDLLRGIIGIASEEHNLRQLLREVAELVVTVAGAAACFVHVVDRDAGELVLMGATPADFDELAGTIRLPIGVGIAGWVAQHGRPAVVEDKWSDARYRYIPALRGEDFSSLVSVPLLRPPGVVVGVLNVHSHDPRHFAADIVTRLEEVASLLAGIVEGAVLDDRLRHREEELERFTARTIELQELERRRIAGDIHDGISQRLVSAWYHLRAAGAITTDAALRVELEAVEVLLSDALEEARHAITGLRPSVLDDLGLTAAITSVATDLGALEVDLDLDECELPAHVETSLYRITQEALQNVVKHAAASRAGIGLRVEAGRVILAVRDDGVGFEPSTAGGRLSYGLRGMHERASVLGGTLRVSSRPGEGTTITVDLPLALSPLEQPATVGRWDEA